MTSQGCVESQFFSKVYDQPKCDSKPRSVQKTDEFTKQVIASSMGSMTSILALNPLNVLKVRLQNSHTTRETVSLFNIAKTIFRNEGIRGFWSGSSVALTMSLPNTVLFMTAYERCKVFLRDGQESKQDPWYIPAVAAGIARVFSVSLISPLELARTIKASGRTESTATIITEMFQKNGLRGLYRGWIPTLWRDAPFSAIYWLNIELWKPIYYRLLHSLPFLSSASPDGLEQSMIPVRQRGWQATASVFLAGNTSAIISAVVTHPFDVVKTQRQLSPTLNVSTVRPDPLLSTSDMTRMIIQIVRTEGWYGIFRGLSMRLLTVMPGSAILVTVYETIKSIDF